MVPLLGALPLDGPLMGEGWEGVMFHCRTSRDMKKYPVDGARARTRILRQNMTEAERRVWQILRLHQMQGTSSAAKSRSAATLLILYATRPG
jgi:hypothetical protein